VGFTHDPLVVLFLVIPPLKSVGLGAQFGVFVGVSWRGVLGVHLSIPLDLVDL
jgi:hypothetical protein